MSTNGNSKNPWLGLKSYSEGKRLYGRDSDIDDLSQKIIYNTQTVIYGKSGIGKSSLLKAGIFPILRRNGFFPVYVRLVHEEGQGSYTNQILSAVDSALKRLMVIDLAASDDMYKVVEGYKEEVVPVYEGNEEETLWEYFHRHQFYYKLNEDDEPNTIVPVLIFDQFEEIFTLQKKESLMKNFFEELAGLLNNVCPKYLLSSTVEAVDVSPQAASKSLIKRGVAKISKKWDYIDETNLHLVISLREDFLSYLERNADDIPSLKHNRYCLLPLSEDQAAEVIMQPIPGLISTEVAKEIICKVTGAKPEDFEIDDNAELEVDSAILSLFLRELYERMPADSRVIDKSLVIELGDNIIQEYYEKTISLIPDDLANYLENKLITDDGRRDSVYKSHVIQKKGYNSEDLNYLKEQRLIREFPWNDGIRIEFIHDVLCPIIVQRREKRRQQELAEFEQAEKERIRQEEMRIVEERSAKLRKRNKQLLVGLVTTILVVALFAIVYWDGMYRNIETRYGEIVKKYGWMVGVEELSKEQAMHRGTHYLFIRKGRWSKYAYRIEARDGYDKLTTEHTMGAYILNQYDDSDTGADKEMKEKLGRVCQWELVGDRTGEFLLQERALDKDGNLIFSYNRSRSRTDGKIMGCYTAELGFPIVLRDSCYFYLRTTIDSLGHEVHMDFFNDKGLPITNKDSAFQTANTYFPNGRKRSVESLFLNGNRMIDRAGNCGWEILKCSEDGYRDEISIYYDAEGKPCRVKDDNTMVKKWEYDEYGRLIKETYWKVSDVTQNKEYYKIMLSIDDGVLLPDTNNLGVHGYAREYNEHGKCTLWQSLGLDGNPYTGTAAYQKLIYDYDNAGNLILEERITSDGSLAYSDRARYDQSDKCVYRKEYKIDATGDTIMYYDLWWDDDLNRKVVKDYYPGSNYYIYSEYDEKDNRTLKAFYTIDTEMPDDDSDKLHKSTWEYTYYGSDSTRILEQHYDKYNRPCGYAGVGSWCKGVTWVDSIKRTKRTMRYSTDSIMSVGYEPREIYDDLYYNGFEMAYDDDFINSVSEISLDETGVRTRTYKNNAFYYEVQYLRSVISSKSQEIQGHYALNEFGEPSLIIRGGQNYSAIYQGVKYDEYGNVIDIEEDNEGQPMIVALEADAALGFVTSDILVAQDDWVMWEYRNSPPLRFILDLDLEPSCDVDHTFKVLRYNEDKGDYELLTIKVPAGDERLKSIGYKKFYCTKKEIKRVFSKLSELLYPHMFELIPSENGALYNAGMTKPGLLVAINDWNMRSHFCGVNDSILNRIESYKGIEKVITVYYEDLEVIKQFSVSADTLGAEIRSYDLIPPYYNRILKKSKEFKTR